MATPASRTRAPAAPAGGPAPAAPPRSAPSRPAPSRPAPQVAAAPSRTAPPAVRLRTSEAAGPSGLPPQVAQLVRSPGSGDPLPPRVQAALESSLEVPLHPVRVHSDPRTAAVVDAAGARAFTYGLHVFLGSGERPTDLALMAHEVAHVVQQQGGPVLQMSAGAARGDAFEQEARATAATVASGGGAPGGGGAAGGGGGGGLAGGGKGPP